MEELIRFFRTEFNELPEVIASAPGRLDFLNTHQDYKGLPVVSIGVNLRTYTGAKRSKSDIVRISSYNLMRERMEYRDSFNINSISLRHKGWFGDYLRASLIAIKRMGYDITGFKLAIYSQVPIGGGMASSAALTVSFIGSLNELFNLGLNEKEIAELAYEAEHSIMGIPCGRLDQYGCSFGGLIKINTRPPFNVEILPWLGGYFTVLDSGIKHSTSMIHPRRQEEINEGLKGILRLRIPFNLRNKLSTDFSSTEWDKIKEEDILPYLKHISDISARRILFTIRMNESTNLALRIIRGSKVGIDEVKEKLRDFKINEVHDMDKLKLVGLIMNYQHILLRDYYDLSLPLIEKIVRSALKAGALGAKISGAGLGGCIIALSTSLSIAKSVVNSGINSGAKRGWIVKVDKGLISHKVII